MKTRLAIRWSPFVLWLVVLAVPAAAADLGIERAAQGARLFWPDQGAGKVYTLQHATDLVRGQWVPLNPWDAWPKSGTWFEDTPAGENLRFYRLAIIERGRVQSVEYQGRITALYLNTVLIPVIENQYDIDIPFPARYDVDAYRVAYETLDGLLGSTTAWGALFVPTNSTVPADVLSYQHGTIHRREDAPSGTTAPERLIGMIMASDGYVVPMPDYLGLGPGSTGLHPYVHRRSSATVVVDMLRATRTIVASDPRVSPSLPQGLSGKLFLLGYSQGAYVTLAAQQEIEQKHPAEFTITASAPSDGPYDLSGTMANVMTSTASYPSPNYLPYVLLSYNQIYHMFDSPGEVMIEPYASNIPPLFDGAHTSGQIDNAMPPSGVPGEILQPVFRQAFAADPNHPFRLILRENDLTGWAPASRTRLYHCAADDVVPYANAQVAYASFLAAGADPARVQLIDPDPSGTHGTCLYSGVPLILQWFQSLR